VVPAAILDRGSLAIPRISSCLVPEPPCRIGPFDSFARPLPAPLPFSVSALLTCPCGGRFADENAEDDATEEDAADAGDSDAMRSASSTSDMAASDPMDSSLLPRDPQRCLCCQPLGAQHQPRLTLLSASQTRQGTLPLPLRSSPSLTSCPAGCPLGAWGTCCDFVFDGDQPVVD